VLKLALPPPPARGFRVLALGAHSDDLEIGCGGTIMRLAESGQISEARWVVFSGDERRADEARAAAGRFLADVPDVELVLERFRDGFFPYDGGGLKNAFERLKGSFQPDLVFTHRRSDAHQDHRLVAELTWNTWRDHLVLEYEVPKYDGDLRAPNVFVELPESICRRKVEAIVDGFPSQADRHWFTEDVFWSLLRLRGLESCASTGYAEGFECRKLTL
jgi:LmbE family N-acetylglucosaminyl deacetylase